MTGMMGTPTSCTRTDDVNFMLTLIHIRIENSVQISRGIGSDSTLFVIAITVNRTGAKINILHSSNE